MRGIPAVDFPDASVLDGAPSAGVGAVASAAAGAGAGAAASGLGTGSAGAGASGTDGEKVVPDENWMPPYRPPARLDMVDKCKIAVVDVSIRRKTAK